MIWDNSLWNLILTWLFEATNIELASISQLQTQHAQPNAVGLEYGPLT